MLAGQETANEFRRIIVAGTTLLELVDFGTSRREIRRLANIVRVAVAIITAGLAAVHDLSRGKAWRAPTLFALYLALVVMLDSCFFTPRIMAHM